jgi:SAM-dependent methyltransferase
MSKKFDSKLTTEAYTETFEVFRKNWLGDREQQALQFIKKQLEHILFDPMNISVLSVGCGTGEFDEKLIYLLQQLTNCKALEYVAVEPNEWHLQEFEKKMSSEALQDVKFEIYPISIEDFQTEKQFDLIHYTHSMYEMFGREERLILEALDMLKEYGRLIIAISEGGKGMYKLGEFWAMLSDDAPQGGFFDDIKLKAILDRLRLPYESETRNIYIDVSNCFQETSKTGQKLLDFLYQANFQRVPLDVKQKAISYLAEISSYQENRRVLYHGATVFFISKPFL